MLNRIAWGLGGVVVGFAIASLSISSSFQKIKTEVRTEIVQEFSWDGSVGASGNYACTAFNGGAQVFCQTRKSPSAQDLGAKEQR